MESAVRVGDYEIDKGLVLALAQAAKEWLQTEDTEGKEEDR